ncbi:Dicarboxylate transport [Marinobacter subterrani]|uniref:Dicarboxylate transport n=1 Tax=Marinobacter subterrani TaxID=1658765 RepID=A0A0J7M226_9GAMM|nr:Dicarboxylate transport [Marinobacter subterrani]
MPVNRNATLSRMMRRALMTGLLLCPLMAAGWSLVVEQGDIGMALPDIHTAGWEVTGSKADVQPSITASGDSAVFDFNPASVVVTERLAYTGSEQPLLLQDLRTNLSDVTLTIDYGASGTWAERIAVKGKVKVEANRITHPRLVPQAWSFRGNVAGHLANLRIQGTLVSNAGVEADLDVQLSPDGAVSISVGSVIEGPDDVRALAATFTGWPELLSVDSGSARVSAELHLGPKGGLAVDGAATLDEVNGVFNRTAFTGLTGEVLATLEGDRMTARSTGLTAEQVNPGIPVSAVHFTGSYTAPISKKLAGKLAVQQANAQFLGGSLRIPPGTYDLAGGAGRIPVELQDISLARLMEVYPAEGLGGSGLLSGLIPISFSSDGVQVEQGRVSAESPGGRLQLPADKLQGMLGGNQAMDVVVKALQNFHYSVLSSTIDYDDTGKLTLDLRLEGNNPEVRGGQPVVLNVNLEEDIPALLTSLQLSGSVNEAVTERVRKLLQGSGQEQKPGKEAVP